MGSLSLAWVGDGSGVSLSMWVKIYDCKFKKSPRCCMDCCCNSCPLLPGAAGLDDISGAVVHDAFWPVEPLQEVRHA